MATNECHPKRPVSVLHFHGTDDKFAPFNGGPGERSLWRISALSVEHTIGCWIKANECSPDPVVTHELMKVEDGTKVTRKTYGGGKHGTEVVLIEIEGGWPQVRAKLPGRDWRQGTRWSRGCSCVRGHGALSCRVRKLYSGSGADTARPAEFTVDPLPG